MNRKLLLFAITLGVFAVLVGSCENESEENRAVVIVSSINDNAPFFSDVLDQGDTLYVGGLPYTLDDFIREDWIPVTFYNRPYNSITVTQPGAPLSDFLITRYRVEWRRVDGGNENEVPPTYDGATSIQVPSNSYVTGGILLVPYEVKNLQFMQDINYLHPVSAGGRFPDEYLCVADITFWGHEVGTKREWPLSASLTVNFADAVVESED
ncbi:MAG: hypothetical protein JSW50_04710 [Candidatus Latescibacterota bacterium]|nr:MAG: hypothetical protein JSW50_04710 [Candidatus Latescibacterota bacterium]